MISAGWWLMIDILKASAGTGKTYRLSLEYVAALLQGKDYEKIAVMTFTRKATAEIRERIFEHIEDILADGSSSEVLGNLKQINDNITIDMEYLKQLYQIMLKNKDTINILTIDSFINQIFKQAVAPYLGIYVYEIIEDEKNREIIEEVFKRMLDDPQNLNLMEKFLKDNTERRLSNYFGLIKKMLKNRWKFLLIAPETRKQKSEENLVATHDQCLYILEEIAAAKKKEYNDDFFVSSFTNLYTDYLTLDSNTAKRNWILNNYKNYFDDTFWHGGRIRGKKAAPLKESLEAAYEKFRELLAYRIYNQEMRVYEDQIFNFCQTIFRIYDQIKFREKQFTHTDISNYTYKYLQREDLNLINDDMVSDYFYEMIGNEINYLLIDEFQDTSILQWKILKPLINRCKQVTVVGDEKQSIYGWRGGEKELFANLEQILEGRSESLQTCYRSQKEIIDFINCFFENLEIDWEYRGVNNLPEKNAGYVEVLAGGSRAAINTDTKKFDKKSEEEQQEIINLNLEIEENLKHRIALTIKENFDNYGEIGILARANDELADIAAELDREDIPFIMESHDSLIEHKAVKPLYFLLHYLEYTDFIDLIKFLRSNLVNINNKTLKYLLVNRDEIEVFMKENSSKASSIKEGEKIENEEIREILFQIKKLKNLGYRELSNHLMEDTGIIKLYQDNSVAQKNLYFFFEIMREFNCLHEFLQYLEENKESEELKQAGISEENAVKLLTVHKAKGLSLKTEFFYWKLGSGGGYSGALKLFVNFDDNYEEITDYLLTDSSYYKLFAYLGIDYAEEESNRQLMEEINNVYVAMTRAQENLYLFIELPRQLSPEEKDNYWQGNSNYEFYEKALLEAAGVYSLNELLSPIRRGKLNNNSLTRESEAISVPYYLHEYFKAEDVSTARIQEVNEEKDFTLNINKEINRIEGLAAHYYLEHIKYDRPQEREFAQNMVLARYGNILGPDRIEAVLARVRDFINKHQQYFNKRWQVFTEYEVQAEGEYYRIDRLLVNKDEKEILILDYKTGITREQSQLDKYRNIIADRITAGYNVKTRFLFL